MSEEPKYAIGEVVANRYKLTEFISENDDYCLYKGSYDRDWTIVVKVYHANRKPNESLFETIKKAGSMNVCRVIDSGVFKGHFCEIRPVFENGNMLSSPLPMGRDFILRRFTPSVAEAINNVHTEGLVHGKIRLENIFISDFGNQLVLGDFGISTVESSAENNYFITKLRDVAYMPPSCLKGRITQEADWYAFGMSLYYAATGKRPYEKYKDKSLIEAVFKEELKIPENVDNKVATLIRGLVLKEDNDRWGYFEIEKYLKGENVDIVDHYKFDQKLYDETEKFLLTGGDEIVADADDETSDVFTTGESDMSEEDKAEMFMAEAKELADSYNASMEQEIAPKAPEFQPQTAESGMNAANPFAPSPGQTANPYANYEQEDDGYGMGLTEDFVPSVKQDDDLFSTNLTESNANYSDFQDIGNIDFGGQSAFGADDPFAQPMDGMMQTAEQPFDIQSDSQTFEEQPAAADQADDFDALSEQLMVSTPKPKEKKEQSLDDLEDELERKVMALLSEGDVDLTELGLDGELFSSIASPDKKSDENTSAGEVESDITNKEEEISFPVVEKSKDEAEASAGNIDVFPNAADIGNDVDFSTGIQDDPFAVSSSSDNLLDGIETNAMFDDSFTDEIAEIIDGESGNIGDFDISAFEEDLSSDAAAPDMPEEENEKKDDGSEEPEEINVSQDAADISGTDVFLDVPAEEDEPFDDDDFAAKAEEFFKSSGIVKSESVSEEKEKLNPISLEGAKQVTKASELDDFDFSVKAEILSEAKKNEKASELDDFNFDAKSEVISEEKKKEKASELDDFNFSAKSEVISEEKKKEKASELDDFNFSAKSEVISEEKKKEKASEFDDFDFNAKAEIETEETRAAKESKISMSDFYGENELKNALEESKAEYSEKSADRAKITDDFTSAAENKDDDIFAAKEADNTFDSNDSDLGDIFGSSAASSGSDDFGFDDIFGSGKSEEEPKEDTSFDDIFGSGKSEEEPKEDTSFDDIFGSGKSEEESKEDTSFDDIFGSGKREEEPKEDTSLDDVFGGSNVGSSDGGDLGFDDIFGNSGTSSSDSGDDFGFNDVFGSSGAEDLFGGGSFASGGSDDIFGAGDIDSSGNSFDIPDGNIGFPDNSSDGSESGSDDLAISGADYGFGGSGLAFNLTGEVPYDSAFDENGDPIIAEPDLNKSFSEEEYMNERKAKEDAEFKSRELELQVMKEEEKRLEAQRKAEEAVIEAEQKVKDKVERLEAERKAKEEEIKRLEAERRAKEAEDKLKEAERLAAEEAKKRREAELKTQKIAGSIARGSDDGLNIEDILRSVSDGGKRGNEMIFPELQFDSDEEVRSNMDEHDENDIHAFESEIFKIISEQQDQAGFVPKKSKQKKAQPEDDYDNDIEYDDIDEFSEDDGSDFESDLLSILGVRDEYKSKKAGGSGKSKKPAAVSDDDELDDDPFNEMEEVPDEVFLGKVSKSENAETSKKRSSEKKDASAKKEYFEFNGGKYNDINELVIALNDFWKDGVNALYSGDIADFYEDKDEKITSVADSAVEIDNKNLGLFKFICDVTPQRAPLMYKKSTFKNLRDLSDDIYGEREKDIYAEMLKYGIISYYLIKNGETSTAEKIINLEDRARDKEEDKEVLMYVLMYTLSTSPVYLYGERAFENLNSLLDYLYMNAADMDHICSDIFHDKKFFGWLDFLGYGEDVKRELSRK